VHVKFRSGKEMITVQGKCSNGVPDITIK
jgi:hypothetical protein